MLPSALGTLHVQPPHDRCNDVRLFLVGQCVPSLDAMPLRQAPATAGRRRVLRDEDRVAAKWRLPAVIRRTRRREPLRHEGRRVLHHCRSAFRRQVRPLLRAEPEPPPEGGPCQRVEELLEVAHDVSFVETAQTLPVAVQVAWRVSGVGRTSRRRSAPGRAPRRHPRGETGAGRGGSPGRRGILRPR